MPYIFSQHWYHELGKKLLQISSSIVIIVNFVEWEIQVSKLE